VRGGGAAGWLQRGVCGLTVVNCDVEINVRHFWDDTIRGSTEISDERREAWRGKQLAKFR
jgi:hypothetical protein